MIGNIVENNKNMTLLVIQEQHFTKIHNGQVWVNETSDIKFWDRYLDVFEKVVVCARMEIRSDNDTKGLIRSDRPEVEFCALPNFRGIGGIIKNINAIRKSIKKAISKSDCIIYRAPSPISLVAYPIVKASGKPFAVELMNNPLTQYSKESMNNVLQPLIRRIVTNQTKDMCQTANGVSYVTNRTLQELFPCRAITENSSNYFTSSYSTIRLDDADYRYKDFPTERPDPIVLVHGGKMNDYRKGQDLLIDCVKELRDLGYNVELNLMGTGLLLDKFKKKTVNLGIDCYVHFLGWKAGYKEVQEVLQNSHLFVFPSMGEGLPRSVIEAMANGLLPIASDVDGIVELLPEELMVHNFDKKSFIEKLKYILDNWNECIDLRNQTYQQSLEYKNTILSEKRRAFYSSLKNCCNK